MAHFAIQTAPGVTSDRHRPARLIMRLHSRLHRGTYLAERLEYLQADGPNAMGRVFTGLDSCRAVRATRAIMAATLLAAPGKALPTDTGTTAAHIWLEQASQLVDAARDRAPAGAFRKRVIAAREQLRGIVRAGQARADLHELHINLVLLQSLLQAASDCHRGGRVLCPPSLMRQLDTQLAAARTRLSALED